MRRDFPERVFELVLSLARQKGIAVDVGLDGASPTFPGNNISDVIRIAKQKPKSVSMAISPIGTPNHLGAELLAQLPDIELTFVPYGGIGPATPDLIAGRVDLAINGSYWVGSAIGAFAALGLLNTAWFPRDVGWRLAFALGAVLGLGILVVRRSLPESPRWLFIHGREGEAARVILTV